jgi:hypothetical protein
VGTEFVNTSDSNVQGNTFRNCVFGTRLTQASDGQIIGTVVNFSDPDDPDSDPNSSLAVPFSSDAAKFNCYSTVRFLNASGDLVTANVTEDLGFDSDFGIFVYKLDTTEVSEPPFTNTNITLVSEGQLNSCISIYDNYYSKNNLAVAEVDEFFNFTISTSFVGNNRSFASFFEGDFLVFYPGFQLVQQIFSDINNLPQNSDNIELINLVVNQLPAAQASNALGQRSASTSVSDEVKVKARKHALNAAKLNRYRRNLLSTRQIYDANKLKAALKK